MLIFYPYKTRLKIKIELIRVQIDRLYFWIGQNSTIDEQGAVAHHVTKMDTEAGGNAKQIRVVQGKEPQHLQHIFKHLVIYRYVTKH